MCRAAGPPPSVIVSVADCPVDVIADVIADVTTGEP